MRPRRSSTFISVVLNFSGLLAAWRILPILALGEVPAEVPPELSPGSGELILASPDGIPAPYAPDGSAATSAVPAPGGVVPMEPAILPSMPDSPAAAATLPGSSDDFSAGFPETPAESVDRTGASASAAALGWDSVLPSAPSGFSRTPGGFPLGGGMGKTILDGFTMAATLSGTYDSNVTQSPGQPVAPIEDDFFLSLGGNVSYLSKASEWTFGGSYRGSYDAYFNNTDFSGYNQGGALVANYNGGKFSASMNLGIDYDQGANRYYSSSNFVERTNFTTGLDARYRLSSKTSLQGNIGQTFTSSSDGYDDTESFDIGAAALWKYSPLTEWGPGIRYSYDTGSSQTDRSSIGPTMTVNYKLSKKVTLNSRVGVDFASYEDGGSSDPMVSGLVGLNYQASTLWGMNFSLYRDTQADPSVAGGFNEITALRLGYHRKIRRATLGLGLGYESNTSEIPGATGTVTGSDRDYFSVDGSLGMPIFSKTTMASLFMRYGDQSGNASESFDSLQTGFSLSRGF